MRKLISVLLVYILILNSNMVLAYDWTAENYNTDPLNGGKPVNKFSSWFFESLPQERLLQLCGGSKGDRELINNEVRKGNIKFDVLAPASFTAQAFASGVYQGTVNNCVPGKIYGALIPGDGSSLNIGGLEKQIFIPMYRMVDGKKEGSCYNTSLAVPFATPTIPPQEPNSPPSEPNNPQPPILREKEVIKIIEKYVYIQDIYSVSINYPQSREIKGGVVYGNSLSGGGLYLYSVPGQEEKKSEGTCTPTVVPTPPSGCTPPSVTDPVTIVTPPAGVTPVGTPVPVTTQPPSPQNTWGPPTPPTGI